MARRKQQAGSGEPPSSPPDEGVSRNGIITSHTQSSHDRSEGVADESEHEDDPLGGPSDSPPFLEQLLLALIDAHPLPAARARPSQVRLDVERERRLRAALKALTNQQPSYFIHLDGEDRYLLREMAELHHRNKCKIFDAKSAGRPHEPELSDSKLAEIVLSKHLNQTVEQEGRAPTTRKEDFSRSELARYNRLREKYSGIYWQKHGKYPGIDFRRTRIYFAIEHDYIQDSVQMQNLEEIAKIFVRFGIRMKLEY